MVSHLLFLLLYNNPLEISHSLRKRLDSMNTETKPSLASKFLTDYSFITIKQSHTQNKKQSLISSFTACPLLNTIYTYIHLNKTCLTKDDLHVRFTDLH